jgi:hypothetical protein
MDEFLLDKIFNNQFVVIYFGALVGHIFSLNKKGFKGTIPFLSKLFAIKNKKIYSIIDFLLAPLLGAIVIFLFLSPDNIKMSIYTGITWSTTLLFIAEFKGEDIK